MLSEFVRSVQEFWGDDAEVLLSTDRLCLLRILPPGYLPYTLQYLAAGEHRPGFPPGVARDFETIEDAMAAWMNALAKEEMQHA